MAMATGADGMEGVGDELVLKDEISGSDESDSSSVQILDNDQPDTKSTANNNGDRITRRRRGPAQASASKKGRAVAADVSLETGELLFDSFVVDTETVEDEADNSAYHREDGVSSSHFCFSQVISHHAPAPKRSEGSKSRSSGKSCFNCGLAGHELSACPEPRDARRISQNRNNFGRRRESGSSARFHEQRQGSQPGLFSDTLRDALGLGNRDLPPWIYRMRKRGLLDGYPPGYRKRATERKTVKFHMEEDALSTVGRRRKRTHAQSSGEDDQCKIISEQLIRYPGFNFDDGSYVDHDTQHWLIPPWDTFVQGQQHYVDARRQRQRDDGANTDEAPVVSKRKKMAAVAGGGVGDGAVVLNGDEHRQLETSLTDNTKNVLTLNDAEEAEDGGSGSDGGEEEEDCNNNNNNDDNVLFVDASGGKHQQKANQNNSNNNINQSLEEGEIVEEPEEEEEGKMMELGTPVPVSHNMYHDKPDSEVEKPALEKWSIGIQAFKHQPPATSTGFFKRMHQIVKSVRKKGPGRGLINDDVM